MLRSLRCQAENLYKGKKWPIYLFGTALTAMTAVWKECWVLVPGDHLRNMWFSRLGWQSWPKKRDTKVTSTKRKKLWLGPCQWPPPSLMSTLEGRSEEPCWGSGASSWVKVAQFLWVQHNLREKGHSSFPVSFAPHEDRHQQSPLHCFPLSSP